jgi:ferric-dicitrate binding protein FerR (iron transport regulator)
MSDFARWSLLLDKLRAGQCDAPELDEIRRLARGNPERAGALAKIAPWLSAQYDPPPGVVGTQSSDLASVMARIREESRTPGRDLGARPTRDPDAIVRPPDASVAALSSARGTRAARLAANSAALWRHAALLLLAMGIGAAWWNMKVRGPLGGLRGQSVVFHTRAGERASFLLQDSTAVTLAPGSTLTASRGFGPIRELSLSGEAYFSVRHDAHRAFRVRAGNVTVEDIGTVFNVRAYEGDTVADVAVAEGRVSIASAGPRPAASRDLTAGDVAVVSRRGDIRFATGSDVAAIGAWRNGTLAFDRTPLGSVAQELTRWYGVPFRVTDSTLAAHHITLTLSTEHATEAAAVLCGLSRAQCSRGADGALVISPVDRH